MTTKQLFLWAGQSNAVGVFPVPAQNIFPEITAFGNDYRWHTAVEPCDNMGDFQVDPVNYDAWAAFGATKRFGIIWRTLNHGDHVGMIPTARSGTSIAHWQPAYTDDTLYGAMLKRAYAAQLQDKIKGFVFIQGEGDTIAQNQINAETWHTQFVNLVNTLRVDLDNPTLPVVYAQIAQHTGDINKYINWEMVQNNQALVAGMTDNIAMVDMSDTYLPYNAVHYNVAGYNLLASRLAVAMDALINN